MSLFLLKIKNVLEVALHHLLLFMFVVPASCRHGQGIIGLVNDLVADLIGTWAWCEIIFAYLIEEAFLFRYDASHSRGMSHIHGGLVLSPRVVLSTLGEHQTFFKVSRDRISRLVDLGAPQVIGINDLIIYLDFDSLTSCVGPLALASDGLRPYGVL